MIGTRVIGQNHIYLDEKIEGYSNIAVGLLLRAVGHGLKVAYVDVCSKATKFTNFLENLSLSYSFVKKFDRLHVETFVFKENDKISKAIIPLVEFYSINNDIFWKSIGKFDLVIFDNVTLEHISQAKIKSFMENKDPNEEAVFIFSDKKGFNKVKDDFDLISELKYTTNNSLISKSNITNITGNGKGKSTFSFGYLLRGFIAKADVKLVYFDKGGDFYGERFFFNAIKKWSKENNLYGTFDYVATGMRRFDGQKFRFENIDEDIREAKEGLMLLKTALKKQTPVIAEELNTTIRTGLLKLDEVLEVVDSAENELLITGRYSPKEILDRSGTIVEVNEIKHYSKSGKGVRKGIDF